MATWRGQNRDSLQVKDGWLSDSRWPSFHFVWRKDAETQQGGEDKKADRSETKTTQKQLTRRAAVSQPEARKGTGNWNYETIQNRD